MAAIARETALIEAYEAALRSAPAAAVLADFRLHHDEHLARLRVLRGAPEPAPATEPSPTESSPAGSAPAGATSSGALAPAATRALFASLAAKEDAAAAAGATASATAGPNPFAELLAEIAGSEGQHAALLPGFPVPASS